MDGVAISIIGRPRPLPGHDTPNAAHNTYTLKCEEPVMHVGGWFVHCRLGMKDCELIMVVLRGGLSRSRSVSDMWTGVQLLTKLQPLHFFTKRSRILKL